MCRTKTAFKDTITRQMKVQANEGVVVHVQGLFLPTWWGYLGFSTFLSQKKGWYM